MPWQDQEPLSHTSATDSAHSVNEHDMSWGNCFKLLAAWPKRSQRCVSSQEQRSADQQQARMLCRNSTVVIHGGLLMQECVLLHYSFAAVLPALCGSVGQKAKRAGLHPRSMGLHGLTNHNTMHTICIQFPAWQTLAPEGFPNFLSGLLWQPWVHFVWNRRFIAFESLQFTYLLYILNPKSTWLSAITPLSSLSGKTLMGPYFFLPAAHHFLSPGLSFSVALLGNPWLWLCWL